MSALLTFATWLCGESAGRQVFEPLLADWQRELRDAAHTSPTRRLSIVARGSLAFTSTLAACFVRCVTTEGDMWKYGVVAFALAVGLSIASEVAILGLRSPFDYPLDVLLIAAVRWTAVTALATAMLPALFLLRRDPGAGPRIAGSAIALGILVVALAVVWLPNLENSNFLLSADQNERIYQRALANDRAGLYQYPGTALRQRREGTTSEQRKVRYEQFLSQRARVLANHPTPSSWQLLSRSSAPVLGLCFGVMGWSLGVVVQPTLARAAVWWGMAWLVTLAVNGRLAYFLRQPDFHHLPWWVLPAATGATALALAFASTRKHRGTSTLAPTP